MSLELMRIIDLWLGRALCLLLWPLGLLMRFFRTPEDASVSTVLIIKLSELGAMILAYPSLCALKQRYPQSRIRLLTFKKNAAILSVLGDMIKQEDLILIDDEDLLSVLKGFFLALKTLSQIKVDLVLDYEFYSRISAIFALLSGAPRRVGFDRFELEGLYRGNFLTHRVMYNPLVHVSINYMSLVRAIDHADKKIPTAYESANYRQWAYPVYVSQTDRRKALERFGFSLNKKIFLMNPGEGVLPLREWPLGNFKKVAEHIVANEQHVLILVGTEGAKSKAHILENDLGSTRVINLTGQTTLLDLLELMTLGHMVITNDGGLAHLAMLTPIHQCVLFGPESPQIFGPVSPTTHCLYSFWPCSPCLSVLNHRQSRCQDNQCLKAISPQTVLDIINHV